MRQWPRKILLCVAGGSRARPFLAAMWLYGIALLNCLPGHRRTIDSISKLKSVARTSEECKAERSTVSSTARLRRAASGGADFTSLEASFLKNVRCDPWRAKEQRQSLGSTEVRSLLTVSPAPAARAAIQIQSPLGYPLEIPRRGRATKNWNRSTPTLHTPQIPSIPASTGPRN